MIILAALQNLSSEVNDAALIDGCSRLRRVFAIDLPAIRGPLALILILSLNLGMQEFAPMLVITKGGPINSTMSPAYYLYFSRLRLWQTWLCLGHRHCADAHDTGAQHIYTEDTLSEGLRCRGLVPGGVIGPLMAALLILAIITYVPFVFTVINSFKINAQFFQQFWLPTFPLHPENYVRAWPAISRAIFNSFTYSIPTLVLTLVISGLAGYAFARYRFPGRNVLFIAILALIMIPGILLVIPMFSVIIGPGLGRYPTRRCAALGID